MCQVGFDKKLIHNLVSWRGREANRRNLLGARAAGSDVSGNRQDVSGCASEVQSLVDSTKHVLKTTASTGLAKLCAGFQSLHLNKHHETSRNGRNL